MYQTALFFFTHFNSEILSLLMICFAFFSVLYVVVWLRNKERFGNLGHYVPAKLVDNYLSTIIENSNALKSSLFRGDRGPNLPSVLSMGDLAHRSSDAQLLNMKEREVQMLTSQLKETQSRLQQLEIQLSEGPQGQSDPAQQDKIIALEKEVKDLIKENQNLQALKSSSGDSGELEGKLKSIMTERDEFKERLKEYEIIEDDLANLKSLQKENQELKEKLAGMKGGGKAEEAPKAASPAPESETSKNAPEAKKTDEKIGATIDESNNKSAQDLLSEFEKMLG